MHFGQIITFLMCFALISVAPVGAEDGKKIYISADMEGLAGAVTMAQLGPGGFEYEKYRKIYTAEVNAAIDAAFKAGATEILVSDSHGNGQGLLVDELNQRVQLVRSWPRPFGMMQGIDDTFDGVFFIGYHASATSSAGIRAHTMSSAHLAAVKLNGVSMSEASFNAAIAGHFGVPVLMISGDNAATSEAASIIGNIEEAVVKWAYGFHSGKTLLPTAAKAVISEKAEKAMAKIGEIEPYKLTGPIELDITFQSYQPSEVLAYLPIVERIDARTVRYVGKDMVEVSKFLQFVESFSADMKP
jgi:D-amino peptidase